MKSGRSKHLVGRLGEYLVCVELGHLGFVATPFAGNVPDFDVVAVDALNRSVPIQVKTSSDGGWQFGDARRLLDIDYNPETGVQIVRGLRSTASRLVYVFVWTCRKPDRVDRFFVLSDEELQATVRDVYERWLMKHNGKRPKKPDSFHTAIHFRDLERFENRWQLITERLSALHDPL